MNKRTAFTITAIIAATALLSTSVSAASKTDQRMDDAIEVIREFTRIPEQGIPDSLLRNAYGVAVIPGTIKAGFMIGGRYGKGVLVVRQDDGNWSNPSFVTLGGGSLGWQIGAQSTDIVLVFKDRRSVDNIFNGKLTLGGDASVAAGPVGRQTSAATDQVLTAEIYSYSRNRGLFAGVSLEGSWLGMDKRANENFYGNGMSPQQILAANSMAAPMGASQFVEIMSAVAPGINVVTPINRTATAQAKAIEPAAGTETYSIEPLEYSGDETSF
jgi:lipid-binding SYLF domain-containing protein